MDLKIPYSERGALSQPVTHACKLGVGFRVCNLGAPKAKEGIKARSRWNNLAVMNQR